MNFFIIAGEASGDLHASNLIKELKKLDTSARFRGWGGDMMKKEGAELVMHYRDIAYMGFAEVVLHMTTILRNIEKCKKDILAYSPNAIILIDYPGFNLRIARFAHKHNFKVFYYISPQVWAWKESRVKEIKKYVDRMFVILPFEKNFYARFGYPVEFVGHPLLDVLSEEHPFTDRVTFISGNGLDNRQIIALLPGSRKQEIKRILAVMLQAVDKFPEYQFIIGGLSSVPRTFYEKVYNGYNVRIVYDQTYDLIRHSWAAIVASGTATLETALIGIPQVIVYKGGFLSYQIAKRIVDVSYIGLVNLIMERSVVAELVQNDFNPLRLADSLRKCVSDNELRNRMLIDYQELKMKLGGRGASHKAASLIIGEVNL
jgi:lipid-A-disaccharide synthase